MQSHVPRVQQPAWQPSLMSFQQPGHKAQPASQWYRENIFSSMNVHKMTPYRVRAKPRRNTYRFLRQSFACLWGCGQGCGFLTTLLVLKPAELQFAYSIFCKSHSAGPPSHSPPTYAVDLHSRAHTPWTPVPSPLQFKTPKPPAPQPHP